MNLTWKIIRRGCKSRLIVPATFTPGLEVRNLRRLMTRAPEWKDTVNMFLGWWDRAILTHSQKKKTLTITTEFGPVSYMPTAPYTKKLLADQWELNLYMLQLLKSRYAG